MVRLRRIYQMHRTTVCTVASSHTLTACADIAVCSVGCPCLCWELCVAVHLCWSICSIIDDHLAQHYRITLLFLLLCDSDDGMFLDHVNTLVLGTGRFGSQRHVCPCHKREVRSSQPIRIIQLYLRILHDIIQSKSTSYSINS